MCVDQCVEVCSGFIHFWRVASSAKDVVLVRVHVCICTWAWHGKGLVGVHVCTCACGGVVSIVLRPS